MVYIVMLPISTQCSMSIPPEPVRKPKVLIFFHQFKRSQTKLWCTTSKFTKFILNVPNLTNLRRPISTSNNEHDCNPVKYLNIMHLNGTQKHLQYFFLKILQKKILLNSYFGYFEHVWPLSSKTVIPTCRNFDVYLHVKNELNP